MDGRQLTLSVTLSAAKGTLSVDLTSDVLLTAPADTPLAASGVTHVQGGSLAFTATVAAANAALLTLVYDRQPFNVSRPPHAPRRPPFALPAHS